MQERGEATTQSSQHETFEKILRTDTKAKKKKLQRTWVKPLSYKTYTNFFPCQFLDDVQIAKNVSEDRILLKY